MKKRMFLVSLAFIFLLMVVYPAYPVFAQNDTDPEAAGDDDVNYEVSLIEADSKFEPDLILPDLLNQWNLWKLTRLIEKGSINYKKTITLVNSSDADVTFDEDDIIVNIQGDKSGEELGKEYFNFEGLDDKTFEPNREFQVNVTLLAEKLKENKITPDTYSGYFKFWVNEMNNYLEVPVGIDLKSPIWIPILVLLIAALAVPLGKAFVEVITSLEIKAKYDKFLKRVKKNLETTVGAQWFETYLEKLYKNYKSGGFDKKAFDEQLGLVKKMLVLLEFEIEQKVLEKCDKAKKREVLAQYEKLSSATKDDIDVKIQKIKEGILQIVNPTKIEGKTRSEVDRILRTTRKPFRAIYDWLSIRFAGAFLNLITFISWFFVTAILIFWGLSQQYSGEALWGVNPIKDWGAIFTWVFSSSLTTTSVKDLIQEKILSKGG